MIKRLNYIVEYTLKIMITEAPEQETDNSPGSAADSPFTPAEERFLGKFDAYGTQQLGIIYSISDIGIREFIGRSGKDLNVTPGILLGLLRNNIIYVRSEPFEVLGYIVSMILYVCIPFDAHE